MATSGQQSKEAKVRHVEPHKLPFLADVRQARDPREPEGGVESGRVHLGVGGGRGSGERLQANRSKQTGGNRGPG